MPVLPFLSHAPHVGDGVFLTDTTYVVGRVHMSGPARLEASAVLRGDQHEITIGPRFRMGGGSSIHVEATTPTVIGSEVWIGENAVVHATWLGDGVRVEDNGLVLSGSRVGGGSVVASGSLVPEGVEFPENSYISGTPGRRLRETTSEERAETRRNVAAALSAG